MAVGSTMFCIICIYIYMLHVLCSSRLLNGMIHEVDTAFVPVKTGWLKMLPRKDCLKPKLLEVVDLCDLFLLQCVESLDGKV